MKIGVVAIVLFFVAPAAAEMGSFDLVSDLPIQIDGSRNLEATGTLLITGNAGQFAANLHVNEGALVQVVQRATGYISPTDPELSLKWTQTVTETKTDLIGGLQIERLDGFQLLATDASVTMQQGSAQDSTYLGTLTSSKIVQHDSTPDVSFTLDGYDERPFIHAIRGGQLTTHATDGVLQSTGGEWFIGNANLVYNGQTYTANERIEHKPGQIYDPVTRSWTGGGTHEEYVFEYFLLDFTDATIQLHFRDTVVQMYSKEIAMEVLGNALFPDVTGKVSVGEELHELSNEAVEISGKLAFTTEGRLLRGQSSGEGDITKVTYGQASHDYSWAVAAIGIGAALVALGAWVSGGFKWLASAGIAGIAGYARVQGSEVLEHPGRAQVYNMVQAEPGMHFNDLLQRLSFGQSSLNYHLRVLEKNNFVTRVKDGRYARFFDRQNGHYSQGRKEAVSTLRNGTTAAIAEHVIRNPGVAQKDLSGQFGIAPSTVSWHIQRLASHGLVDKERVQNHVRYYMGDAWMTLPEEELCRFGLVA